MPRSVFLSYVHEDKWRADQVRRWFDTPPLSPEYVAIDEAKDMRHLGDATVWDHLSSRIQGSTAVLCLVGNDTHNHAWVRKELALAITLNKRVLLMRLPDTTGLAPLDFRNRPLLAFDPSALLAALRAFDS